ncbi:MAG: L,D-transpeptidase family protein [Pseudolabrys sp.]|nr:L,D-transpeptidase family protein [Pseudolabrys sp.]
MKRVRIDRLAASTALGLVLVLGGHDGRAQQAPDATTEQQIDAAVPMPDTSEVPPPTALDFGVVVAGPTSAAASPAMVDEHGAASRGPSAKAGATPTQNAVAPVASAGDAVADALRTLIETKLDRYVPRKTDRAGVEAYYKAHGYKPLWVADGGASARAKAAIAYLANVDAVGLYPSDYPAPNFAAATSAEALAEAELTLTNSVLTYARHAQTGQISFTRVGADIQFDVNAPEPVEVLATLAEAADTAAALDAYNPPQPGFKALKEKLAELREKKTLVSAAPEKPAPRVHIPEGRILRLGMKDPRVIALRQRLDIPGDKDNPLYDEAVRDAVKTFQTEADLVVDGNLGPATTRALNGERREARNAAADPIDTVLVNMERWRWLPRRLGNAEGTYVMVNVPDYTLTLYHHDKPIWTTKIVAGKPGKATPMTTADMKFITVNPTWNVPPSIIENEYLPALQQDPEALDRIGLKVRQDPDGTVHIYQPPGAGNALGRIRFNFPNKFLVYQHDTPDKYLFAREKRAYSHGCMRVQDPLVYATKLLAIELPQEHYTPAKLESMFGGNEININFPKPIPVHLTYQTAFVDENGKLQIREDVYGRDARMIAILKNNAERKVADIPIERHLEASARPVKLAPGSLGGDRYDYDNGGGFFDWIFGGPRRAFAPPRNRPYGPQTSTNGRDYFWR